MFKVLEYVIPRLHFRRIAEKVEIMVQLAVVFANRRNGNWDEATRNN